jgi:archaellum component FlaG (FlaF/FlaG flagellin family)
MYCKKSFKILSSFILALSSFTFSFSTVFARMSSDNYQIISDVVGSSEGASGSSNYNLLVNMGEEGIGVHNSDNWTLKSGFLQTINSTITISVDQNTINLGSLTPGSSITETTTVGVITDAVGGYTLSANFSSSGHTETLRHTNGTTYISDLTDWDPTSNSGNGNASSWSGSGFGFCVYANNNSEKNTTWWGTGTTESDSNNLYAGFPASMATILSTNGYKSGERQTGVGYKLQVPSGQLSGTYSGNVTYTATVNL